MSLPAERDQLNFLGSVHPCYNMTTFLLHSFLLHACTHFISFVIAVCFVSGYINKRPAHFCCYFYIHQIQVCHNFFHINVTSYWFQSRKRYIKYWCECNFKYLVLLIRYPLFVNTGKVTPTNSLISSQIPPAGLGKQCNNTVKKSVIHC